MEYKKKIKKVPARDVNVELSVGFHPPRKIEVQ